MNERGQPLQVAIAGAGRLGSALARGLAQAGHQVNAIWSRSPRRAQALAASLRGCRASSHLEELLEDASLVFIVVPDDAIVGVTASLPWSATHTALHCSGALGLEVLQSAADRGARVGSFHPLQLFTESTGSALPFAGCSMAIDAPGTLHETLSALARDLGATPLHVPAEARAAYHAASHYAAAFICVLLAEGESIFTRLGIKPAAAAGALQTLALGTLAAVQREGAARAMAGVYSRGDAGTAARHVEALKSMGAESALLYRTLALRSVDLALQAGRVDAASAQRLRALLRG